MKKSDNRRFFEFDTFRVDVDERQLLRDGDLVAITPKDFDILLTLIENRGRTMTKEDLMDSVWQDTFVYEGNLNRHISTLRKLLGDHRKHSRLITTIPKRGYRFDGEIREIFLEESAFISKKRTRYRLAINEFTGTGKRSRKTLSLGLLAAAAVVIGVIAVSTDWRGRMSADSGSASAFTPNVKEHGTDNPEAYDLYLDGRRLWQTRNVEDLHNATFKLEKAVELDPQFARAHAALADAYVFDFFNWMKAEELANTAIQLDPSLAEPHATIGFIRTFWQWKPKEAEQNFKQAIALDPDYATAHQWYAMSLAARARMGFAMAEIRRAIELEPESVSINADLCQMLYFSRKFDLAIDQCRRTLEMDPKFLNAHSHLYDIYTALGRYDEAIDQYFKIEELSPTLAGTPSDLENLRSVYNSSGIRPFWKTKVDLLNRTRSHRYRICQYHSRLKDREVALECFEQAYKKKDLDFVFFAVDPTAYAFLQDPRYVELAGRLSDLTEN